jgi:NAD(P)H dehydrogenase (quinone)
MDKTGKLVRPGVDAGVRCIMLNDRLRGVGVKEATMEILGGMVEQDPRVRERNLERVFELGRMF